MTKGISSLFFVAILACSVAYENGIKPNKLISAVDIIAKFGYQSETHLVQTEDGYIVTLHRILSGKTNNRNEGVRPPVFLMHGLSASSANFVDMGPERGLGFILTDSGYDVWMGNARGNSYSQDHISINVTENPDAFFNFSLHEIGAFDLPANIDYILNATGQEKLHYIGHSQGCTTFYMFASTRPEYNSKIRLASLMGPAGIMKNPPDFNIKFISQFVEILEQLAADIHLSHLPLIDLIKTVGPVLCAQEVLQDFCRFIYYMPGGFQDDDQTDKTIISTIVETIPSDASIKQFLHYAQGIKSGIFRQYDLGAMGNMIEYGQLTPPEYNISAITAPVALYYGKNDIFVSVEDVKIFVNLLPNVTNDYLIPYEKFNHGDFLYANDVVSLLYNELIDLLQKY